MALTKEQKKKQIDSLKKQIEKQKSVIFVDFEKVPSPALFQLRDKLKSEGCNMKIAKKTLARIAFGQLDFSFWDKIQKAVPGQMALIFGIEDEMASARIAYEFSKKNEHFKILGGLFENIFTERDQVLVLANLPSKQVLLGKLAGSLASPMSGLANVLQGPVRGMIFALRDLSEKQGSAK